MSGSKAPKIAGGGRARRLADMDMSLPAGQQRKPKRRKAARRKTAQMDHAVNPRARRHQREGERRMDRWR